MTTAARRVLGICLTAFLLCSLAFAQSGDSPSAIVPRLVNYSGKAIDSQGKAISGVAGITFSIYKDQDGGAPLWMETQNVTADARGNYTVQLGAMSAEGLPLDLFTTGEARWLDVRVNGAEEQPRILLLSVPYALKAADAQTLSGLPASAFLLAGAANAAAAQGNAAASVESSASPATSSDVTTSGGTVNTIPLFTTATNVQNSLLSQSGTTAINVVGKLNLPALGTATASAGFNSRPQDFVASSYNSSSKAAVPQTFQLQAEPAGNDTATAAGTLNLLYGSGTTTPAETGLKISNKGLITFATGQTFPTVTGNETVTGDVTASELISTVATGTAPLKVTSTTEVANLNASLLGGKAASAFAQLGAANTFTGNNTLNGGTTFNGVSLFNGGASFLVSNDTPVYAVASTAGYAAVYAQQTSTSGGTGVQGTTQAASGYGVAGYNSATSGSAVGVYGQTPNCSGCGYGVYGTAGGTGVYGISSAGGYGVYGQSSAGGYGVFGQSSGSNGYAVYGLNSDTSDPGADGVHGVASNAGSSGVAGLNNNGGPGVYGYSSTGNAMVANGNASQSLTSGGWVKGMVYVNGSTAPYSIVRCFNSTLTGAAATTPPCGFTLTENGQAGNWLVDFGFDVYNRIWSATLGYWPGKLPASPSIMADSYLDTQLNVYIWTGTSPTFYAWNFTLVVY